MRNTSNHSPEQLSAAAQWVNEILGDWTSTKGSILSPERGSRDSVANEYGEAIKNRPKFWFKKKVQDWLSKMDPQDRSFSLYDAVDHLLGSEVFDREDAMDDELDREPKKSQMSKDGASVLREVLREAVEAHDSSNANVKEVIQMARERLHKRLLTEKRLEQQHKRALGEEAA